MIGVGRNGVILLLWCVIFFINEEEINDYFFDGIRKIFFSFGIRWWFIFVSCYLYLKLEIECKLCIKIFVLCFLVNLVISLLNFRIFIFFSGVVICFVNMICLVRVNIGFLLELFVIVRIIWLNIFEVWVIKFKCLLVIGLNVFG